MLELSSRRTATPQAAITVGSQQTRRLVLALVLLLAALAAVLIKDRDFWFGNGSATIETNNPETSATVHTPASPAAQPNQTVQPHTSKKQMTPAVAAQGTQEQTPVVTAKRTILPPLDVEVVAGSKHTNVRSGSNATKLEIAAPATKSAPRLEAATNAAQHEALADAAKPAYPPLAQHMNVQGSVVLQALIGADGTIENLRVTSGPAILATAAQQAVREWHFKPIIQNGQAVESKATITVNFTIKVADNSANATIAESRPEQILVLTR
jgi:periplasmic protein TonB